MTSWVLAVDGTVLNVALAVLAWRFYRRPDEESARRLFLSSNLHLPLLLTLFMLHKKMTSPPPPRDDPVTRCHDGIMEVSAPTTGM
jgi:heme O synthase-like polyprenyltransferase